MGSGEYAPFAVTQEKPKGPKPMKWALIFFIPDTGIYETGLTFKTFLDCHEAAAEIRKTDIKYYSESLEDYFDSRHGSMVDEGFMQCVPKK